MSVALVVMRHRAGAARFHRQARLGAVERPDLALFVDREYHRMSGRVEVEADNVLEFSANLGSFDSLNVRMRGGRVAGPQGCVAPIATTPAAFASIRPVQWLASPCGAESAQIDHPLHRGRRQRRLAGFVRLVAREPFDASAMKRAC